MVDVQSITYEIDCRLCVHGASIHHARDCLAICWQNEAGHRSVARLAKHACLQRNPLADEPKAPAGAVTGRHGCHVLAVVVERLVILATPVDTALAARSALL